MTSWNFKERGEDVQIFEPVAFIKPETIVFKNHIVVSEFAVLAGGLGLHVGNYIHIAAQVCITGGGICLLEDFSNIAAGTRVITGTDDFSGAGLNGPTIPEKYRAVSRSFVHLKRHAFLGTNVIVFPGVTIGEGAVAASGSVVTRDLEPWTFNLGSPAKKIKDRPKETMLRMEKELLAESGTAPSDVSEWLERVRALS